MKQWYNDLGYYNNPFSIKPAAFSDKLFGYEEMVEELFDSVDAGEICFLEGAFGTGKSTILKSLVRKFKGKRKLVYYNLEQAKGWLDLDGILKGRNGFLGAIFGIKSKNTILFLDEASLLTENDLARIVENHESGHLKAVVFAADKVESVSAAKKLKPLVQGRIFKLGNLSPKIAIKIVRDRIGDLKIISDDVIVEIAELSETPRDLLKNTEDVLRYALESGQDEVGKQDVRAVLG